MLHSFRYAFRGIAQTIKAERNMRIHLTAVAYVTALGVLAGLDAPRWAAVLLCFGAVIGAELFNTALENLCDAVHPETHPKIGAAKDAAAGAVLVLTICSVGVAVAVFGPWLLAGVLLQNLWVVGGLAISVPLAMWFVVWPQKKEV